MRIFKRVRIYTAILLTRVVSADVQSNQVPHESSLDRFLRSPPHDDHWTPYAMCEHLSECVGRGDYQAEQGCNVKEKI